LFSLFAVIGALLSMRGSDLVIKNRKNNMEILADRQTDTKVAFSGNSSSPFSPTNFFFNKKKEIIK
jgi:hypothetical protein